MVRHEKRQGDIDIAWGYDDYLRGYFLSIKDERLKSQGGQRAGQSAEVSEIVDKVDESGSGYYFQLHTYFVGGFGHKVSQQTMFTFMRRYGIDPDTIHDTITDDDTATLESMANKPNAAAKKKKKKKKKKNTPTTAAPSRTEYHPSAENRTEAKTAASVQAVASAQATAVTAAEAAAEAQAAAVTAAEAAAEAQAAAVTAAEAATNAVNAANAAKAAAEALTAADTVDTLEVAEATEVTEEYLEFEQSEEEIARTTFLYVPVEGDIQVLSRSIGTKKEILQWPCTESHVLSNLNLVHEPYILTGTIRSFDFDGPINKRYSKIYGKGTATIRGPAMIVNENAQQILSLTEKDIPRIFR